MSNVKRLPVSNRRWLLEAYHQQKLVIELHKAHLRLTNITPITEMEQRLLSIFVQNAIDAAAELGLCPPRPDA